MASSLASCMSDFISIDADLIRKTGIIALTPQPAIDATIERIAITTTSSIIVKPNFLFILRIVQSLHRPTQDILSQISPSLRKSEGTKVRRHREMTKPDTAVSPSLKINPSNHSSENLRTFGSGYFNYIETVGLL